MPEAAEVAVAATQLAGIAVGRRVDTLDVTHPRSVRHSEASVHDLIGGTVTAVRSHGKWILVDVDNEPMLGIHLRMSGQLLAAGPGDPHPDRHVHAVFGLGHRPAAPTRPPATSVVRHVPWVVPSGRRGAAGTTSAPVEIWFRDPRTFGELRRLDVVPGAEDLFAGDLDAAALRTRAERRRVGVKAVLLDQAKVVAGVGSYLADEALHCAGVAPTAPAAQLSLSAWERILESARALALASARLGGVTLADEGWVDLWGRPGTASELLQVHARQECGTCGSPTRSATVGGRRARWCGRCQPARRRR